MSISSETSNSVAVPRLRPWPQNFKGFHKVARFATICLACYWLAIFAGTHIPSRSLPSFTANDKLCHFLAFGGLAFLLAWAIPANGKKLNHVRWAAVIAVLYSIVDELTQTLIPGRSCDLWDMAADCMGVALGLIAYLIVRQALLQVRWGRSLLLSLSR